MEYYSAIKTNELLMYGIIQTGLKGVTLIKTSHPDLKLYYSIIVTSRAWH